MKILILGSHGMLGQALVKEARSRQYNVVEADIINNGFDIRNDENVIDLIEKEYPDIVINSIAIVNLKYCEQNPDEAYKINARPLSILTQMSKSIGFKLIHISTDHFYLGDRDAKHKESDSIEIVNEYSRSKYLGERLALLDSNALVVRTNVVGFRGWQEKTFLEWAIHTINHNREICLFEDFYTSSIDVKSFSHYLFNLIKMDICGVINLASSDVSSKAEFIKTLAKRLGRQLSNYKEVSVHNGLEVRRADSLGLDVSYCESLLGVELPSLIDVIDSLAEEYCVFKDKVKKCERLV